MNNLKYGRVTIPTDLDMVKETIEVKERLGADALRDCDGTKFPKELSEVDGKIYATYYTTRNDNVWAKANMDEVQQMYIMTKHITATNKELRIYLMDNIYPELLKVNSECDIYKYWEVINRTTNTILSKNEWTYCDKTNEVIISNTNKFHEYTVSFLAFMIWDPVHMYNAVTNGWTDFERQITFDIRQPKSHKYSLERLRKHLIENDYIDVIRFTTFFHQFTLVFDKLAREKYVDWYGYSGSVSPYIIDQFEKEYGYKLRAEYIIDEGYYNNNYRLKTKEFNDFVNFQVKQVCALAKEHVDICHEMGVEAMMFLGDHWIGTEPFLDEFKTIGLDALVGSVGNGQTYRLISDVEGVKYREGRFLPYFFPDTFCEGKDPVKEAKINWVTARRAMLRKPIDRIGYGGYLKLALQFPKFIDYIEDVCNEFRTLYENSKGCTAYAIKKVAVLNSHGNMRKWAPFMVHHAIYHDKNYSYAGIIEVLSGAPYEVDFISFDDILNDNTILNKYDTILNIGDANTSYSGDKYWLNETIVTSIREYVYNGGSFIGVGEPSAKQYNGHYFQLANLLGVELETGFDLNKDKYNWDVKENHFILQDIVSKPDFGASKKYIYALDNTDVLYRNDLNVELAVNDFGKGRACYISGLPYSFENARLLHRAIMYITHDEDNLYKWYSTNVNVDVHAYVENKKYCVVNNTYEPQKTTVYKGDGTFFEIDLKENEIIWYEI